MIKKISIICLGTFFILGLIGCPKKIQKLPEVIEPIKKEEIKEEPEVEPPIHGKEFQSIPEIKTIYFTFDKYEITPESLEILQKNAEYFKTHTDLEVLVEGHCCECGTNEYNISLGQKRAQSVREYYIKLGVPAGRVATISYGEEKPVKVNAGPPDSPDCVLNRRAETKVRTITK